MVKPVGLMVTTGFLQRLPLTAALGLTLLAMLVVGCPDSKTVNPEPPAGYPTSPGSRWTYWAYDSLGQHGDTIDVEILEELATGYSGATSWTVHVHGGETYIGFLRGGTNLVEERGDSLLFYWVAMEPEPYPYLLFEFPLETGRYWKLPPDAHVAYNDSTIVVGRDAIHTEAGFFPDAVLLRRQISWIDCAQVDELWFAADVGVVGCRTVVSGLPCIEQTTTWELLSYDVDDE